MRSDIVRVERQLQADQVANHRADSLLAGNVAGLARLIQSIADSLAAQQALLTQVRGDTRVELFNIQQQLVAIQELTGQSQQRLSDLRTQLEERRTAAAAPAASGNAPDTPAGATPAGEPTAEQLMDLSVQQLRRGSVNTARTGFRELLRRYPQSPHAADGLYFIGESFAAEAPDSAQRYYQQVVDRYAASPRAATALYKLGLLAEQRRDAAGARAFYGRVIQSYPNSDEAALARDRLRSLGR